MKALSSGLVCLFRVSLCGFRKICGIITCWLWRFVGIVIWLAIGLFVALISIGRVRL
jgi:hypothetical protein